MAKRKAMAKPAKDSSTSEQMRVKHTEMLNASFFRWIQDQHANHRSELWRNGLEEYLRYGRNIQDRFPVSLDSEPPSTGGTSDTAPQPRFKQSRLGVMHSQQDEQVPTIAAAPNDFGRSQRTSKADSSSHKPVTFSIGGSTPAGKNDTAAAQRDSMQPLALPPFVVPAFNWAAPPSPGIFSPAPNVPDASTSSPAASSSLPFGSASAWAPLATEASTPTLSTATASLPPASTGLPTTATSSLFGNPPASTSQLQPTAAPASNAARPAPSPMAFGNSLFPAPLNASTSDHGNAPGTLALPAVSGSDQMPVADSTQPTTEPKFSFGAASSTTTSNAPLFSFGASQPAGNASSSTPGPALFNFGSGGAQPAFGFGSGATPPAFGSGATPPAFGSGATLPAFGSEPTPPFAFGSSQPAASTSAFGASTSAQASPAQFSWTASPSASFGNTAGAASDAALSASGPSTSAPFSFSWNPPSIAQPSAAPANGAASFAGFSFSTSGNTGFSAFGGQNGSGGPTAPAEANGTEEEEDQPEPDAPTEYVKDEGVITSQEVSWRFMNSDKKWTKVAKGRVLARKSDKGTVYLQFVTSSGQVVATANIGNLKPHQTKPVNLLGLLYVSTRHISQDEDTYDAPVPKTTMLTCKSETLAQELVEKLT